MVPPRGTSGRLWQILLLPATQHSIEEGQFRETLEVFLPRLGVL
jgi:hypothetical protein